MSKEKDFFKLLHKRTFEEATKIPTADEIIDKQWETLRTNFPPLVKLGTSKEQGDVWIREEEREDHMHILGTTGEGKSKFIEYLVRGDLQRGHGVCFLDPTDRAWSEPPK